MVTGTLWAGTEIGGLYAVNLGELLSGAATVHNVNEEAGLVGNHVTSLLEWDGKMWVGTTKGLSYWDLTQSSSVAMGRSKGLLKSFDEKSELRASQVTGMIISNQNELWVGTANDGLKVGIKENNQYRFKHYSIEHGLSFYNVKSLFMDRENTIWIGTDVGLNQYISDYFLLYDEGIG